MERNFRPLPEPKRHRLATTRVDNGQPLVFETDPIQMSLETPIRKRNHKIMTDQQFQKMVLDNLTGIESWEIAENLYDSTAIRYYLTSKGIKSRDRCLDYLEDVIDTIRERMI